jgi:hypothetical protein
LVPTVGGWLRGSVHGYAKMLLRHLLGELKVVCMGRCIGHLSLHLKVGTRKVLLWLNHAHVNILLMSCGNLLLLLLEDFDLLCNS